MDVEFLERTPESVRREIRETRHKGEVPIYILTILTGVLGVYRIIRNLSLMSGLLSEGNPEYTATLGASMAAIGMIGGIIALLVFLGSYLIGVFRLYAEELSCAIRVSPENYPEIYEKVQEYTRLLGLKKEPEIYVRQMNGTVNAYTSWVPGKIFIQLNAEIVDLAYMEHRDFETVFFVMAHEFGHAYLHHVQLWYNIWTMFAAFAPFFGPFFMLPLLRRAREYSADRVGQALTEGKGQLECMMMLSAGRHSYKYVNPEAYLSQILRKYNVFERFARFLMNMGRSHPIMPFRVAAIMDPKKKSGRLL